MRNYIFLLSLLFVLSGFAQNYPGKEIIGKSYNVFGEFANNKSIQRYPIFDFSKLEVKKDEFGHVLPSVIYIENISDHIITTIEGSSIQEYSTNLAEKAGLKGNAIFFKGSIDIGLNEFNTSQEELFMYTYMDLNTKWRISMDTRNIDKIITVLDDQFKKDIEDLSPKQLFENYGTHFMSSAYLGGRIEYVTNTKASSLMSKNDIRLAVEATYNGISGKYSNDQKNQAKLNSEITKTKLNVVGGNSEFTNNIQNPEQYKKWAEGIKEAPVLCGFDQNSLMPIWMLTKNEARRLELEEYFNTQLLPKYPFPVFFKKDNVLDNDNFVAHYAVYIDGFEIIEDCDASTLLTIDESGDFQYSVSVYENANRVANYSSPEDRSYTVTSGEKLEIAKLVKFAFPLTTKSSISIKYYLRDFDEISLSDVVGSATNTHKFPFSTSDLYNYKSEKGQFLYKQLLYNSTGCQANIYYGIYPDNDKTAIEFGNKGWKEFELGNYNECINYSRKALVIDNTLWYVQFNVALVYLVQKNPLAFQKYETLCNFCRDIEIIQGALKDITDFENKNGQLQGSEPIKLLLKSKM